MFDWSRIWLIAKRELATRFKQRSYRLTLIIQVIVAGLAALAPIGIAWFSTTKPADLVTAVAHALVREHAGHFTFVLRVVDDAATDHFAERVVIGRASHRLLRGHRGVSAAAVAGAMVTGSVLTGAVVTGRVVNGSRVFGSAVSGSGGSP